MNFVFHKSTYEVYVSVCRIDDEFIALKTSWSYGSAFDPSSDVNLEPGYESTKST